MKRFVETERWSKPWFRRLPPRLKCFWDFLCDNCNKAGVWEPDFDHASFLIGEPITAADLESFRKQVEVLPSGKWWLVKFVEFQYGKLSKDCRPHAIILEQASIAGILDRVYPSEKADRVSNGRAIGLPNPTGQGQGQGQDPEGGDARGGPGNPGNPKTIFAEVTWLIHELGVCFYGHSLTRSPEHIEEEGALAVVKRPGWKEEVETVRAWHNKMEAKDRKFFPQTLSALLSGWSRQLDRAHRAKQATPPGNKFGVRGTL